MSHAVLPWPPATKANRDGRLRVRLLGGLQVGQGTRTLGPRQLGGTKPRLVLETLLLSGGSPVSKTRLIERLWEGKPVPGSKANLETYVCVLRRHLHDGLGVEDDLVTTTAGGYSIDMTRVDLDVARIGGAVARSLHPGCDPSTALALLERLLPMWDAPLLPDEVDLEWVEREREGHAATVVAQLAAAALKVMDVAPDMSDGWARSALERDLLCELAWLAHIRSLETRRLYPEALRAYERCRRLFERELGCTPGPELRATYGRLLQEANAGDDDLSRLFDAVVALHTASRNQGGSHAATPLPTLEQAVVALTSFLQTIDIAQPGVVGIL